MKDFTGFKDYISQTRKASHPSLPIEQLQEFVFR